MDPIVYWRKFKILDDSWYTCFLVIFILIGVAGLLLNAFVIHFLLCSKKNASKVTSNRYLLINLAVADLLRLVINVPMKSISNAYKHWIFGDLGCQIYGFIGGFAGVLSASTLAIMAIERYYMIKNPLDTIKTQSINIIITSTWLYSLFWASIQLFSEKGYVLEGMLTSCSFDHLSDDFKSRLIILSILFGGFILPFVLLIAFYLLVLKALKKKNHSFRGVLEAEELSSICSTPATFVPSCEILQTRIERRNALKLSSIILTISGEIRRTSMSVMRAVILRINFNNSKSVKSLVKREYRVTKTVIIYMGVYFISWMPYIVIIVMAQIGINIENYITPLIVSFPALFAKSSTILNPLIYTLINPECKSHFKCLLKSII